MKKQLITLLVLVISVTAAFGQRDEIITFQFVPGVDMFYIPWQDNDVSLKLLYALTDEYRTEIMSGQMPVYVDSHTSSMRLAERNAELAFLRANRVKSELIINKGLLEENFITNNHTTAYIDANGTPHKDIVIVTLRIPAREEPAEAEETILTEPEPPTPEPQPEPAPEPQPIFVPAPISVSVPADRRPYIIAFRTNLLYDAFLLPTLGVEWRASRSIGIKLDGSHSWWGGPNGMVQKIWMLNPELRWYMFDAKCFYAGIGANVGAANVYKNMIGNTLNALYTDDTGYQGDFRGAGLTVGYQLRLSRCFSLDFNVGAGYTRFSYDTFNVTGGVRVYKEKDIVKNHWGLTQAGVSLVWTLGGKNKN